MSMHRKPSQGWVLFLLVFLFILCSTLLLYIKHLLQ